MLTLRVAFFELDTADDAAASRSDLDAAAVAAQAETDTPQNIDPNDPNDEGEAENVAPQDEVAPQKVDTQEVDTTYDA